MLVMGIAVGSAFAVDVWIKKAPPEYKTNESGQTYGNVDPFVEPAAQATPDLIAAIGLDGIEGYVYAYDLDGEQPNNPDEAAVYMENLEKEIQNAKDAGWDHLRYIPLYKEDGKTVVGQFGISYPS